MRQFIYVGYKVGGGVEVFRTNKRPTEKNCPEYLAVLGEFKTVRAANFYVKTHPNPHIYCVEDAERISKELALKGELPV